MDFNAAKKIGEEYLNATWPAERKRRAGPILIIDKSAVEKPYGWVFCYNTQHCLETGRPALMLTGPCHILVSSRGEVIHLSTGFDMDEAIQNYEKAVEKEKRRAKWKEFFRRISLVR